MSKSQSLSDIAKIAGVSEATVSRVINNKGYVADSTRRKIEEIIVKNNFHPNAIAQSMSTNKSMNVALYIPTGIASVFPNPYYDDMIHGITDEAWEYGYRIILTYDNTDNYSDLVLKNLIDAIILLGPNYDHINVINELQQLNLPLLSTSRVIGIDNLNCVELDDEEGAYQATNYLCKLNHKKIGFICGPQKFSGMYNRMNGYKEGLTKNNLPYDERIVNICNVSIENGRQMTYKILEHDDVTAIFTASDTFAIGVMMALKERRIAVPEEISVIGFDNDKMAQCLTPHLTTVSNDGYQRGHLAVRTLMQIMKSKESPKKVFNEKISLRLIIQETTAPCRK